MLPNLACCFEDVVRLDTTAFGIEMRKDIKKMLKYCPSGAQILDVGCGFGLPTAYASKFFKVCACDINSRGAPDFLEMIMKMRNIEFKWIQDNTLPYPDESFDGVLLYAVIEHVIDKESLLNECRRILKPEGKLFIYRAVNKRAIAEKLASWLKLPTHGDEVVTGKQLLDVVSQTGYSVEEIGYQGWLPECGLPRITIFLLNQLLSGVPFINLYSHDYYLIASKIKGSARASAGRACRRHRQS